MRKDRGKEAKARARRKEAVIDDKELLRAMIDQALKMTAQASAAIDDALAFVGVSNQRIAAMEAQRMAR